MFYYYLFPRALPWAGMLNPFGVISCQVDDFRKNHKKAIVMERKRLTVLGSTGSIGASTLDIVRQFPDQFQIIALSCQNKVQQLFEQICEFQPQIVCVGSAEQAQWLKDRSAQDVDVIFGAEGLVRVAAKVETDLVVAGIVGSAGLSSTFAALAAGRDIVLANKETMVLAGELIMNKADETGSMIFPADSEHNAIFQSLVGHQHSDIEKIILTASGGPFRDRPLSDFGTITLEEALNHPNWDMGNKITIDSATMMNKGLEIIEAHWLFGIPTSNIKVVIHRESIVHSMVEYKDGSFIAQLGLPDMKVPIAFCLAYPHRLPLKGPKMIVSELGKIHFEELSMEKYPCLQLARAAGETGGAAPAVLNGANEAVVAAFLAGKIQFMDIASILKQTFRQFQQQQNDPEAQFSYLHEINSIEDALNADDWGRQTAEEIVTGE